MSYSAFDISRAIGQNLGTFQKETREQALIDQILSATNPQQTDYSQAISQILSQVSPERAQGVIGLLNQMAGKAQGQQQKQSRIEFYKSQGATEEEAAAIAAQPESIQLELIKQRGKVETSPKQSKFEQALQSKLADEYAKNSQKIESLQVGKNDIDYLKDQVSDVRSLAGIVGTYSGLGESGPKFDAVATSLLDPIIKVYNPAGVLAQSKLQFLKDTFIPNAKDTTAKINGKLEALDKFYQKAIDVAQNRNRFIEQHEGILTEDQYNKIIENESKQLDEFAQQYSYLTSSPEEGEMVTGLVSISNGKKLKPLSKEQAQDLIDKGLVKYGS